MKKLFGILLFLCIGMVAMAQYTVPRFGIYPNQDNTGRVLNYKYVALNYGDASVTINTNAFETIYNVTLKDSLDFIQPNVGTAYLGDQIVIICTAPSGTPFIRFVGSNWITGGVATLSTKERAVVRLIFDGVKWVEMGRLVQ